MSTTPTLNHPPTSPTSQSARSIRRPASHDSLSSTSSNSLNLRPVSSLPTSRLSTKSSASEPKSNSFSTEAKAKTRGATTELLRPVASRGWVNEPTLVDLMRAEEVRELHGQPDLDLGVNVMDERTGTRSWSWSDDPPQSAVLHPPLYGRPGPTPSPDIFATLLHPLLSLSRPPSPAVTPPLLRQSPSSSTLAEPASRSASSLPAHFPPRTPSDPGPTVESQGFVLYLSSLVAWVAFLVWGLLPDEWLEKLGILWYPSREWALLVPAWTIMLAFFVYFSYIALNIFITPPLDSLHTLTDHQALVLNPMHPLGSPHPLLSNSILLPEDAVPALHDLPIGLVNRVTFGDFRKRGDENQATRGSGKRKEALV